MDYRCPACGKDLGKRKRIGAVIARMEIDCLHCRSRIQLNLHPLETRLVIGSFGAFLALAALGYLLHGNALIVLALVAGMAGPMALPVIERTWLRDWPRYAPVAAKTGGAPS